MRVSVAEGLVIIVGTCGVPVMVVVVVTIRLVTTSVTVTSVVHCLPRGLVTVVVIVVVETGMRMEQADAIVFATQVDRALGVGLPGRLVGVATASPVASAPELMVEGFPEGVCAARLITVVLKVRVFSTHRCPGLKEAYTVTKTVEP